MKKIYAVARGSYSDYSVVALFTTEEKAKAFMTAVPDGDYNELETYELDPDVSDRIARGYRLWHVLMRRDGTVEKAKALDTEAYALGKTEKPWIWRRSQAPAFRGTNTPDCLDSVVWAKDSGHAVKVVNEQRAMMIANGEWE